MSGALDLFEHFVTWLARRLFLAAVAEGVQASAADGTDDRARPAWSDDAEISDREHADRVRELQIMMATWM